MSEFEPQVQIIIQYRKVKTSLFSIVASLAPFCIELPKTRLYIYRELPIFSVRCSKNNAVSKSCLIAVKPDREPGDWSPEHEQLANFVLRCATEIILIEVQVDAKSVGSENNDFTSMDALLFRP
jgi:hypothetical protein